MNLKIILSKSKTKCLMMSTYLNYTLVLFRLFLCFFVVLMLYGMQIKENTLLQSSKMKFADISFDSKKRSIIADFHKPNMLLIGCFKDVEWVESILTVCESLTPICQIQNTKMSKKLLNTKTVKYIVYIASRSSQGSYNLKPLLECLSESKRLTNEIVTIRRDNVMPSDILIESKQISISDAEEEWISGLMDAIAMTGKFLIQIFIELLFQIS